MSPYTPTVSDDLKQLEDAVMRLLSDENARQMSDLFEVFRHYGTAAVKSAVWHLVDQGRVRIQSDWTLKSAA